MKKHILTFILLTAMIILLSGCSWVEYFVVTNETKLDISIEYRVENPNGGFPIFDNNPSVYGLTKRGNIDWDNKLSYINNDTSRYVIKMTLHPNCAIIIGNLSDDHYQNHSQYFINGRVFNIKNITIINNGNSIVITKDTFDDYFKKKNGYILYSIK